jgi:hypothetical protein
MPDKDGWLTEQEILVTVGISHFTFVRLRALGLVPKGNRESLGRGVGTTPYLYPPYRGTHDPPRCRTAQKPVQVTMACSGALA